jgi:hypothetical protein
MLTGVLPQAHPVCRSLVDPDTLTGTVLDQPGRARIRSGRPTSMGIT